MSLVIQIGNSDNKLTRQQWSVFIHIINCLLNGSQVHFRGGSAPEAPFENYCWVVDPHPHVDLRRHLAAVAHDFLQDSIAVIEAPVEFIKGQP